MSTDVRASRALFSLGGSSSFKASQNSVHDLLMVACVLAIKASLKGQVKLTLTYFEHSLVLLEQAQSSPYDLRCVPVTPLLELLLQEVFVVLPERNGGGHAALLYE
jgi:hypothetical protein